MNERCQVILQEIWKLINAEKEYKCITRENSLQRSKHYIQFRFANAPTEFWRSQRCHYEFVIDQVEGRGRDRDIHIEFHCERSCPKWKEVLSEVSSISGLSRSVISEEHAFADKSLSPVAIEGDSPKETAAKAVTAMKKFIELYGKQIDEAIGKNRTSGNGGEPVEDHDEINLDACVELLKNNRNIILHGAPGTGKTWVAQRIAEKMIFEEKSDEDSDWMDKLKDENSNEHKAFEEQCGFVQFHQSYDYTDFVEGLRPKQEDGSKGIFFERKNGVFKEFCANAAKNVADSRKTGNELHDEELFKENYDRLIEQIEEGTTTYFKEKTEVASNGKTEARLNVVGVTDNGNIELKPAASGSDNTYVVSFKRLAKLARKYKTQKQLMDVENVSKEFREVIRGANTSNYWAVLYALCEEGQSEKKTAMTDAKVEMKPFVFIIDEINRGEMSKIFGELFFSIDPGYRGEKGRISTQYQNLVDEGDVFENGFFVPENVYIIGTMNDIDRSVESMDFAMRRRFAFKEVTAAGTCEAMFCKEESWKNGKGETVDVSSCLSKIRASMEALNDAIWKAGEKEEQQKETGLTAAYHIGGAYFLKFANYYVEPTEGTTEEEKREAERKAEQEAFSALWKNHLEGLLREYLRGRDSGGKKLDKLQQAYESAWKISEPNEKPEQ